MLGFVVGLLWVTVIAVICLAYLLPNVIPKSTKPDLDWSHARSGGVSNNNNLTEISSYGHHGTKPSVRPASGFMGGHNDINYNKMRTVAHTHNIRHHWYDFTRNTTHQLCCDIGLPSLNTILFLKFFWNILRISCIVYFIWKNLIFDLQSIVVSDNWKVEDTISILLILSLFFCSLFVGILQSQSYVTTYKLGLLLLVICFGCDITVLILTGINEYWIVFGLSFAPILETLFYMVIVIVSCSALNSRFKDLNIASTSQDPYMIIINENQNSATA